MGEVYESVIFKGAKDLRQRGIAIIEIGLIVMILGALAVLIIPRLQGPSDKDKQAEVGTDIRFHLATALKLYELDNGHFPTTRQGLGALLKKPKTDPIPPKWNEPYIQKRPVDPWGRPYVYMSPGEHRMDYDLSSTGKDTESEEDDIVNWK